VGKPSQKEGKTWPKRVKPSHKEGKTQGDMMENSDRTDGREKHKNGGNTYRYIRENTNRGGKDGQRKYTDKQG